MKFIYGTNTISNRREILTGIGVFLTTSVAGCSQLDASTESNSPNGTAIGGIRIVNNGPAPRTVSVTVTAADETYHDETYNLAPVEEGTPSAVDSVSIQNTWGNKRRRYTLDANLEGSDSELTVDVGNEDVPCIMYGIWIEDGRLNLFESKGDNLKDPCPPDA